MKLNYYKNLDGVRAIAALMVVFFHFFREIEPNSNFLKILSKIAVFGQTGVTLFFVLSGFLITRILFNTKDTSGYFKNFYLRRALRIFPLYYLFLIIYYYLLPIIVGLTTPSFSQQIFYYIYLQNFASTFNWDAVGPNHLWSLAVEEHFYLFWPFIVYFFSPKNLTKIIVGIIVGALFLRIYMLNDGYGVFYFTFTRFDSLAIGALLAILEMKNYFKNENAKYFLILLFLIFVPTILMWTYFAGEGNFYIQTFKYLFISLVYFSIIGFLLSIKENHAINGVLKTRLFSYTGKISYGLYVYHPIAYSICITFIHLDNIMLNFVAGLIMTYLMASVSFYLFESPFLRLKKYFDYNKNQQTDITKSKTKLINNESS
jgi:peptidoglycan/LPS O-acetylase OafA/YrhL